MRVSKLGQRDVDDLRSPDLQHKAIAAFAAREGVEVEWLNTDINVSGANADRDTLEGAIARIEAGDLAGLVVYRLDRLSRLPARQRAELFDRIEGAGGRVLSTCETLDQSSPEGRFVRELFLGLARMQWEQHRDGFARASRGAVERGVHAHAPFGYRKGRDRRLVAEAGEADLVRRLFAARAEGASWQALTRLAEHSGLRTRAGGFWSRRSIENIVHNRAYLGEAKYGDAVNPDAHEAIVDPDLWTAANEARGERPGRGDVPHLLRSLVRCAGCSTRMAASVVGQRRQRVYRCRRHGDCPAPASVDEAMLDKMVSDAFLARYGDVEVEQAGTDAVRDAAEGARIAEAQLERYRDMEDTLGEFWGDGLAPRVQAVHDARHKLAVARAEAFGADVLGPDGAAVWPDLDIDERRRLLVAGIDAVFVRRASGRTVGAVDPSRVRVVWHGEAPADLPGPGRRATIRAFDW